MKTKSKPADVRNYAAEGAWLKAVKTAGTLFLRPGKRYLATSDVTDNRVSVVDESGKANLYLATHFKMPELVKRTVQRLRGKRETRIMHGVNYARYCITRGVVREYVWLPASTKEVLQ
jgi:hypothetical protein